MEELEQIEKIASSRTLQGSDALCNLLRYLGRRSIGSRQSGPKEYEIATEALGRGTDFDPRTDSTVRVAVARLRAKLHEYYEHEGSGDLIRVEIPKGSYRAVFHQGGDEGADGRPGTDSGARGGERVQRSAWNSGRLILGAIVLTGLGFLAGFAGYRYHQAGAQRPAGQAPAPLQRFWGDFIQGSDKPIVVYSNAQFVGRADTTGLRYFDPEADAEASIVTTYTGVGEVMAVHALGQVFWRLGRDIEVTRGSLLSWDAVKNADVIFVGGPVENLPVRELQRLRDDGNFVFEPSPRVIGEYGAVLVNRRPLPREPAVYDASQTHPGRQDYALIRLTKGFELGRRILILAGVTTRGTQAAVEFVSQPEKVETLLSRLGVEAGGRLEPFECVLEVDINRGVPIDSRIVAVRTFAGPADAAENRRNAP